MGQLITTLLIIDFLLLLIASIFGDKSVILSSQIAFISSTFVIFASFASYKSMVKKRLEALQKDGVVFDDRDEIDKIDDPYSVFDDSKKRENISVISVDEVLKEEKNRLKESRRGLKETVRDMKPSFNPFRILSYGILVGGFLYLNSEKLLNLPTYLISLSIPTVVAVWILLKQESIDVRKNI